MLLLDEDRGVLVARAARGLEEEVRQGVQVPLARGFAGRVAAEGRPIIIEDLDHADVVNPILRQRGIRSMLGVPVHVEGRVIGVMHIGTLVERAFDEDDVMLLQLAADRAALAIDNARLSEQRSVTADHAALAAARRAAEIPGLRFSAKYLPAGSGIKIGGDWYDVFQLAQRTARVRDRRCRRPRRAGRLGDGRDPRRACAPTCRKDTSSPRLSRCSTSCSSRWAATAAPHSAILELDPEAEELEAVIAGHLPPLLIEARRPRPAT